MINSLKESLVSKEDIVNFEEKDKESLKKEFILNDAIKAAGDYGKYHKINLLFLCLVWIMIPSIPIMLPYFRMLPNYQCADNNSLRLCTKQEICDSSVPKINAEDKLKTWATDFNINCEKHFYFGLLGASYFLGILCGNIFIANFTDSYGRKPVLISYLFIYIAISIITVLTRKFFFLFVVLFCIGIIYSGTSLCIFVLNFESSSIERKSTFSTILSMSYGIGAIFHILIFLYFRNWIITVSISCISLIMVILYSFQLQESPEFLYVNGRTDEMIQVLRFIANVNNNSKLLENYIIKHS